MKFERFAIKIFYENGTSNFVAFGNSYNTNNPQFYMLYSTKENASKSAIKHSKSFNVHDVKIIPIYCEVDEKGLEVE